MTGNDRENPAERVAEACDRWGDDEVVRRCAAMLRQHPGEPVMGALLDDEVPRVRKAAALALGVVAEGEHADAIRALRDDPDPAVAGAAANALVVMSRRLDRRF